MTRLQSSLDATARDLAPSEEALDTLPSRHGDHIGQFVSPNALACYAGKAPVTRRSGKSEYVVATRLACDRYLRDAVQAWAFCSLNRSGWARGYYDAQRARGRSHHAALRALGNRWLEILWHCLTKNVA